MIPDYILDDLEREGVDDVAWYGDPWNYDVNCPACGHVTSSSMLFCPRCDTALGVIPSEQGEE